MIGWLLSAVALAGAALIAELAGRRWMRRRNLYYVHPPYYRRLFAPNPEIHPDVQPSVRMWVNRDGEVADQFPSKKAVYRVLVIGGSAVESALVDQPLTWTQRLQSILSQPASLARLDAAAVHVGNIGRSGYVIWDVDAVLEKVLPRYERLDLLCIMVGVGDVLRWLEAGAPTQVSQHGRPLGELFEDLPLQQFGWRPRTMALPRIGQRAYRALVRPVERRPGGAKWLLKARAARASATEIRTAVPDATALLESFERGMTSVVQRAKRTGARVMVLRQPVFRKDRYTPEEEGLFWNGGIGNAYRGDEIKTFFATSVITTLCETVDGIMSRVSRNCSVEYVDGTPALQMSSVTFFDHFHLTAAGCDALAAALAKAVLAR
jgi:lysophospholipase L1-like esterase